MKFKMFSVVTGTEECISKCPFCVSCEKIEGRQAPDVNWRNFHIACNLANRSNVDTVMLTSRGEPLLYPEMITNYLKNLHPYKFPFIELQTNGILFMKDSGKWSTYNKEYTLKKWYELGLTTITISVVSDEYEKNRQNYTPHGNYINLKEMINYLHSFGFSLRLTCILQKGITSTTDEIKKFIEFAKAAGVEQTTLRPLNMEYRREEIKSYLHEHMLTDDDKENIQRWLESHGTQLLVLDDIGTVWDVNGQNVMFSVPLTANTRSTDPDNRRNLIFFEDGHLRYEWEKTGGILL